MRLRRVQPRGRGDAHRWSRTRTSQHRGVDLGRRSGRGGRVALCLWLSDERNPFEGVQRWWTLLPRPDVSYDRTRAVLARVLVFTLAKPMLRTVRDFENFHILLWLIKDTCWLMDWPVLGTLSIAPTLGFALYITYRSRESTTELVHNTAVCLWIVANSLWMLGEFFYEDTTRPVAVWFFVGGLSLVGGYYLSRLAAMLKGGGQAS